MKMMFVSLKSAVLFAMCAMSLVDAFRLVAAPVGSCTKKRAYGIFGMQKSGCAIMGGAWNGNPSDSEWISCHIDWCDVPAKGSVAAGAVWGLDRDQGNANADSSRTYGIIGMTRRDCDNLMGRYNGNPTTDEWIGCHLFFLKLDGTNRQNVDSLILAGVDECSNKVAYGIITMIQRECLQVGGAWNGNPGANDWTGCHLDICLSPIVKCEPSDLWVDIQTCRNPSSSTFTCRYDLTTGIEKGTSQSSTQGGSVSVSVTSEVGVELEGLFTASASTTFTTGFDWSTTVGSHQTWSESTTRTLQVEIGPGEAVTIKQVVGKCGDFSVDTSEYRVENVPVIKDVDKVRIQGFLAKLLKSG